MRSHDSLSEICRLSDAKRRISRLPTVPVEQPFYELVWDNIAQKRSFGDYTKVSHLYCPWLGYHFVYSLVSDSAREIMATISYTVNFIERQYNIKVRILKIDGETALLGDAFDEWKRDTGIKITVSAPNNHDQHGRAEKSGGVLINRATKLRLSGNLPDSIWPEIYEAAGYILNRSPTRRLGWKSPTMKLHEWLGRTNPMPKCYHLRPYGCRAYAFIHNRPKLDKLAAKAHVGYLVGYMSTNIWRIWIPTLKRVIPIRDVTFDTTKRYDPKDDDKLDITEEEAIAF